MKEFLDNGTVQEGEFVGQFIGIFERGSRIRFGVKSVKSLITEFEF